MFWSPWGMKDMDIESCTRHNRCRTEENEAPSHRWEVEKFLTSREYLARSVIQLPKKMTGTETAMTDSVSSAQRWTSTRVCLCLRIASLGSLSIIIVSSSAHNTLHMNDFNSGYDWRPQSVCIFVDLTAVLRGDVWTFAAADAHMSTVAPCSFSMGVVI